MRGPQNTLKVRKYAKENEANTQMITRNNWVEQWQGQNRSA